MRLEDLLIERFRCIGRFSAELPPGRVLIVGDNAKGKTTLLEAIFYLVTGRSFRTRADVECIAWGAEAGAATLIRGRIRRAGGDSCRLAVTLTAESKSVRIDDQPLERLAGLWGRLRAVLFTPDDLQLVKGGPTNRRRYLDVGLSQISGDYLFHLQRYSAALRQRNAFLKQGAWGAGASLREEIAPWDAQLAEHGAALFLARLNFVQALEPRAASFYRRIAEGAGRGDSAGTEEGKEREGSVGEGNIGEGNVEGGIIGGADFSGERLEISYSSFVRAGEGMGGEEAREYLLSLLREGLEDDLRRGQTERGPHRDDFVVSLGGKGARDFGSQGQVRSCVMALRLAEMSEMESRTGESPILLLDDLASELDPSRKERVLELLKPQWQTFMTTTRRSDFPGESSFATVIQLK